MFILLGTINKKKAKITHPKHLIHPVRRGWKNA
jgi:hypothetical protein